MPTREQNNLASELNNYFESLATRSVHIAAGNYIEMGAEEMAEKGANINFHGTFGMVYEPIDAKISLKNLRDTTLRAAVGLWFLKFAPKNDFAARQLVQEEAYRIALQFLAKIRKDQEDYLKDPDNESLAVTNRLDMNDVEVNLTGVVGDQHYGYALEFKLVNDGEVVYTAEEWA